MGQDRGQIELDLMSDGVSIATRWSHDGGHMESA